MPAIDIPWDATIYLKLWIVSVVISAMAYGAVLSVALSYIPLLLKTSDDISRRMRNFLLLYVVVMVAISSVYTITMVIALMNYMLLPVVSDKYLNVLQNGFMGEFCVVLANWGADGFMLWRCAMLYQGISRPRWIALLALLVCVGLMSFGMTAGLIILCADGFNFTEVLMSTTILLNLITAALITLRILHFQRFVRRTVGLASNSPYTMFLVICLESSALIVVINALFLILFLVPPMDETCSYMIPLQLLIHVYVLSPLLIIYRVARGKAVTATSRL